MFQDKVESVQKNYPSLEFLSEVNEDSQNLRWEGWVQPIRSVENLSAILDDIENDRAVIISNGGNITHDPNCQIEHSEHRLINKVTNVSRLFKISIEDFCSNHQPYARVLEPEITEGLRKHTWGTNGICGFEPWKYPWDANTSSIVEFIDHCVIWLFKWNVFAETSEWIGSETPHDEKFLLNTIQPNQSCYCGNGRKYANCHRIVNGASLFGDAWIFFEVWLQNHNSNIKRFRINFPKRKTKLFYEQSRTKTAF
jgi:hypothetical protein